MGGSRTCSTAATRVPGVLLATLALVVTGCSSGSDSTTPPRAAVSAQERAREAGATLAGLAGRWTGEWRHTSGGDEAGSLDIEWRQGGRVLRGSVTLPGMSCVEGADVTAVVSGAQVAFEAIKPPEAKVTFTGTIAGDTIDGTYEATCGDAKGVWQARKA